MIPYMRHAQVEVEGALVGVFEFAGKRDRNRGCPRTFRRQ